MIIELIIAEKYNFYPNDGGARAKGGLLFMRKTSQKNRIFVLLKRSLIGNDKA